MLKQALELQIEKNQLKVDKSERILERFFHSHIQNIFSADHLMTEVGKRLLKLCFPQPAIPDHQIYLDLALQEKLKRLMIT